MSNIYILEPPTNGKVLLVTSVGDIDIELWSKEAPKACRNFVQLCMEGYYDGTIFHRLVPEFIVQGGDPTGTGSGGESIYGKPFQDEFHSRLRFVRRGLVAMANAGAHDNGSQFFFTLGATPELNSKHTIFGKVGGNTIYNMIKLGEGETDRNERPLYAHKILKTKIISNPFDDIVLRIKKSTSIDNGESKKSDMKATKNFKLLSFGEEAEEEERSATEVVQTFRSKGKSSHDLLNDAKLSSVPAVDDNERQQNSIDSDQEMNYMGKNVDNTGLAAESVRNKLKRDAAGDESHRHKKYKKQDRNEESHGEVAAAHDDDLDVDNQFTESKSSKKLAELKAESKRLKMELSASRQKNKDSASIEPVKVDEKIEADVPKESDEISAFRAEGKKYKEQVQKQLKKGSEREAETLKMLAAFQSRLESVKKISELVSGADDEGNSDDSGEFKDEEGEDANDLSWVRHKLQFESSGSKVMDANVHDVDRYTVFDPRNPLTQRRREASEQALKKKR